MKKKNFSNGRSWFYWLFLCESLINDGHYVICCDNFYTGSEENLKNIYNHKNFELLRHDITFPLFMLKLTRYTILPALHHLFIIKTTLYKLLKHAFMVQLICWDWLRELKPELCKLQHQKFMVIQKSIAK